MEAMSLHDIYRCPYCGSIAARADSYCRGCGVFFKESDIEIMEKNIRTPYGALPWNTRDRFRCLKCQEFVSITDSFCRGCGDEFDASEVQMMKIKLRELAARNTPSLIGLFLFVLMVIWVSVKVID